jgi:hypothetical protein
MIIKTFEGFFDFFKKRDSDKKTDQKPDQKKKSVSVGIFSKKDDDIAQTIYNSIKSSIESNDGRIKGIYRYQDYKRVVKFKGKNKEYNVVVQKDSKSKGDYVLVIDNKHYIDRKTNRGTVSQSICRKIWNLLDKTYSKSYYDKDNIKDDFE